MDKLIAVLDTSALLAYLKGSSGAKIIENIMDKSIMPVINITEAIIVLGTKKPQQLEYYQMVINELVQHKYETDEKLMFQASAIAVKERQKYNLSITDCYCLALAKELNLPVYTINNHWTGLANILGFDIRLIS